VTTRHEIEQFATQIADRFNPDRIILFGSYAYGTPTRPEHLYNLRCDFSPMCASNRVPSEHRERFEQVARLIEQFGQQHLDAEITGFAIELWKRICRRRVSYCLRGKPEVWAASAIHVIARMNFLFDRSQPVHLSLRTICDFFQVSQSTVGRKAIETEHTLRLRQFSEPGLCRNESLEMFASVRLSNGIVLPWKMAKQLGCLPADTRVGDFL